jgi:hypothetical protein
MANLCVRCDKPISDDELQWRFYRRGERKEPVIWVHDHCGTEHARAVLYTFGKDFIDSNLKKAKEAPVVDLKQQRALAQFAAANDRLRQE